MGMIGQLRHRAGLMLVPALALALTACSGGNEPGNNNGQTALVREVVTVFQNTRATRQAQDADIALSRELLDNLTVASLEVVSESRGLTAYLVPNSIRGPVTVWRTADGAQLVVRNGLVTGSRGLGNDLASSDFAATLAALSQRQGSTSRTLYVRNDVGGQNTVILTCNVQDLGGQALDVVGIVFDTRHIRENCDTDLGTVTQDYWIEADGLVRQSRQWLGPEIGYLRLRLLKE